MAAIMQIVRTLPKSSEGIEELLHFCHRRRYSGKTVVIKPGEVGDTLYYIVEGSVSVSMQDKADGHDVVLAYLNKGEFIGEIGVFMGAMVRDVTVTTREPTQLAEIGYSRLHQLLLGELADHSTEILLDFGHSLSNRLLNTSRKVRSLVFLDATDRIYKTLVELCKQPEAMTHPDGMQIRITRQEIGRIVGCSREMAGKILKNLEDDGKLSAYGKTVVVFGTR
jgi:CRP/FNR family transcriptional regulator, cyclic AMP receptor protein